MKVSIIVTRYNEPNALVKPCIKALAMQKSVEAVVYFLDQKKDEEIKKSL